MPGTHETPTPMALEVDRSRSAVTVRVRGTLDARSTPAVRARLTSVICGSRRAVHVDAGRLDAIGDDGIRALLCAQQLADELAVGFDVVAVSDELRDALAARQLAERHGRLEAEVAA